MVLNEYPTRAVRVQPHQWMLGPHCWWMWFALASADGDKSRRGKSFLLVLNEVHKVLKTIPQKHDLFEVLYSENG